MGQMATIVQNQRHDFGAGTDDGVISRVIGLRATVGLNVCVTAMEEFLSALHREVLGRIHVDTSPVITMLRISFRVFGHQDGGTSFPDFAGRIILTGNELDAAVLSRLFLEAYIP